MRQIVDELVQQASELGSFVGVESREDLDGLGIARGLEFGAGLVSEFGEPDADGRGATDPTVPGCRATVAAACAWW